MLRDGCAGIPNLSQNLVQQYSVFTAANLSPFKPEVKLDVFWFGKTPTMQFTFAYPKSMSLLTRIFLDLSNMDRQCYTQTFKYAKVDGPGVTFV